jgi:hypothetical protein
VVFWFSFPSAVAWVTTEADVARLFFPRYLIAVQPAAALLGAWCIGLAPWRWSRMLVGCLLVGVAVLLSGIVERAVSGVPVVEPRGEDWRGAIAWLNDERSKRPLPVIVSSGLIEETELSEDSGVRLWEYCLYPVDSLYPLEAHPDEMAPLALNALGGLSQNVEMLMVHRGGAWLVVRGEDAAGKQVAEAVIAHLRGSSAENSSEWRMRQERSFGRVQVLRLTSEVTESF